MLVDAARRLVVLVWLIDFKSPVSYASANGACALVWLCGQLCATVAENIVLVTTWNAAVGIKRTAYRLDISLPITTIILRDGTVYFSAHLERHT
ncbi:hypothetical protein C8Q72DRAFT_24604 [Fomitopsis betulina]|nr:hypothetical protein C8Q72DRAFT_24604 [Fomitopsis betulina]